MTIIGDNMKKMLFLLVLLLFPISVMAVGISSSNLSGFGSAKEGDTIEVTFSVNLSGVGNNSFGIAALAFDLDYDDEVLAFQSVSTPGYKSSLQEEDDYYYILSEIASSNCVDNVLYCSSGYSATLTFYVNKTTENNTSIDVDDFAISGWNTNVFGEYSEEDLIVKEIEVNKSHYLGITHIDNNVEKKNSNVGEKKSIDSVANNKATANNKEAVKNDIKEDKVEEEKEEPKAKIYLKELNIEGYKIDFKKDLYEYDITIPRDINSIKVKAVSEDENSKIKIVGDKDLKSNEDKVKIYVTNNNKMELYTINVTREKYDEKSVIKKLTNYLFIGVGVFVLIVLVVIVIGFINKKRFNKLIDEEISKSS